MTEHPRERRRESPKPDHTGWWYATLYGSVIIPHYVEIFKHGGGRVDHRYDLSLEGQRMRDGRGKWAPTSWKFKWYGPVTEVVADE